MLLRGAKRVLKDAGAAFDVVSVPGALEIPAAIMIALHGSEARDEPYEGVVALGCVVRGETSHYDIVAGEFRAPSWTSRLRATCRWATASSPSTPTRRHARGRARPARTRAAEPRGPRLRWCG